MRITNKMMTNNMLSSINNNKNRMSGLEEQYSSGKKIQKPSDDPIIAVRALRLRTNLSELNQYYEKNIPDAVSWMDVTESALTTVNNILSQINTYCVQGSSDTLTQKDRASIVENLKQLKDQIYQEGNANYAGRYVFTGYKTDSSFVFDDSISNLSYNISENFTGDQIQIGSRVTGSYTISDYDNPAKTFDTSSQIATTYRLQLSYDQLADQTMSGINYTKKGPDGSIEEQAPFTNIITVSSKDDDAYAPDPNAAHYIYDTGEIIFGKNAYEEMRTAEQIQVSYQKDTFVKGEVKPEHYFDCVVTDTERPEKDPVTYTKSRQEIQYEINFNQMLTINTEGSDAISQKIGRNIQDILKSVSDVETVENDMIEINKRLQDGNLTDAQKARYQAMLEQMDTDLTLKKELMQKAFSSGMKMSQSGQDQVNQAVADLGSRSVRLQLTENRLSSQQVDFEDLMSKNEDADIVDTFIRYSSAEAVYNASLSAASKIVRRSLLDFL